MRFVCWLCLIFCVSGLACSDAKRINGGGASFIYPAMLVWSRTYEKQFRIQLDYQSTGSGNGVQQMMARTIDFGCTDAFIKDDRMKAATEAGKEIIHIPLAMGAVVPIYNLPGVKEPLRFTGPVLARIYMGTITRWDDAALKELNPGITLPDKEIVPVSRSDSSGTTAIFTDFLSKTSPEWKADYGSGTTITFKRGVGQRGNEGVAGHVQRSPYSMGYVELIFALQNKVAYGAVETRDSWQANLDAIATGKPAPERQFTFATLESVTEAAAAMLGKIPADLRYSLTNAPGPKSYAIVGTNWAVLYTDPPKAIRREIKDFLTWATSFGGEGQKLARELGYAPLPRALCERISEKLQMLNESPAGPKQ